LFTFFHLTGLLLKYMVYDFVFMWGNSCVSSSLSDYCTFSWVLFFFCQLFVLSYLCSLVLGYHINFLDVSFLTKYTSE
jgi:hypothetical protein